jgi:Fe-S cluster biosynthesis and repair protein YggX
MARMVQCVKLGREAEGLDFPPYPGELGKRIWQSVSKEGWQLWLQHQTRLINEYRLSGSDERSREMLRQEMEKFLFEGGEVQQPEQYRPE